MPISFGLLTAIHFGVTIFLAISGAAPFQYYSELALLASWALILVSFCTVSQEVWLEDLEET